MCILSHYTFKITASVRNCLYGDSDYQMDFILSIECIRGELLF